MSNVPKGRRKSTKTEARHKLYKVRDEVTSLMLLDFGFSVEKYQKKIDRYAYTHRKCEHVDEVVERFVKKSDSFNNWFIDKECDSVLEILRTIDIEFTRANSIFPSDTVAKRTEFCERRKHMDLAIAECFVLKQELQYVIRTLPVDLNKYDRFDELIEELIDALKKLRKSDNRFLHSKTKRISG